MPASMSKAQRKGASARRGAALGAAALCAAGMSSRSFVAPNTLSLRGAEAAEPQQLLRTPTAAPTQASFAGRTASSGLFAAAGGVAACAASAVARRSSRKEQAKTELPLTGAALPARKTQPKVTACQATITAPIAEADTALTENAAIVQKTSVLVLGATGTLGRQVVRQFLNAGYNVRCMIRNRADRPFSFLVDWGASVVEGTLIRPEQIPSALIGVHTVVDCSCARPEENAFNVDWEGKKNLIQCCEKMDIQRYIFMSIKDCDKYDNIPVMDMKYKTEQFLAQTNLRYTVLRMTGFMQPLVSQYAVSILDNETVFGDDGSSPGVAYIDSQDAARMVVSTAQKEATVGQTLTISGPKVWSAGEVIALCEKLSGRKADVNIVPNIVLKATEAVASLFLWSTDIAERLRFVEVNQGQAAGTEAVMNKDAYAKLGMDPEKTRNLEEYIGEYYRRVFKKLTKGKYEAEAGELEREKEEADQKLQEVMATSSSDALSAGQPEEREVTILAQRDMSDRLQKLFEDKALERFESPDEAWFGLTVLAEVVNGRSAMMGFALGLFTEWATDVSVAKQIDLLLAVFSSPS